MITIRSIAMVPARGRCYSLPYRHDHYQIYRHATCKRSVLFITLPAWSLSDLSPWFLQEVGVIHYLTGMITIRSIAMVPARGRCYSLPYRHDHYQIYRHATCKRSVLFITLPAWSLSDLSPWFLQEVGVIHYLTGMITIRSIAMVPARGRCYSLPYRHDHYQIYRHGSC